MADGCSAWAHRISQYMAIFTTRIKQAEILEANRPEAQLMSSTHQNIQSLRPGNHIMEEIIAGMSVT
jgi:hypothetical protein